MKTRIKKSFASALLVMPLVSSKTEAATAFLPLAQIPTEVKTGFQYGLGILFMVGFPEIKAKIEERIKNIPADRRERAFVTMARSEAVKETVKSSQGQGIRA